MATTETILGHTAEELAAMTDEQMSVYFKEVFDFEKSLRENAALLVEEKPTSGVEDTDEDVKLEVVTKNKSELKKSKSEKTRLELVELMKTLGMETPQSVKPKGQ